MFPEGAQQGPTKAGGELDPMPLGPAGAPRDGAAVRGPDLAASLFISSCLTSGDPSPVCSAPSDPTLNLKTLTPWSGVSQPSPSTPALQPREGASQPFHPSFLCELCGRGQGLGLGWDPGSFPALCDVGELLPFPGTVFLSVMDWLDSMILVLFFFFNQSHHLLRRMCEWVS